MSFSEGVDLQNLEDYSQHAEKTNAAMLRCCFVFHVPSRKQTNKNMTGITFASLDNSSFDG